MAAEVMPNRDRRLLKEIVCPHCWTPFRPADTVWIAESPELIGDFRFSEAADITERSESRRFLPDIFDSDGNAVDSKGFSCRNLACPHCHLRIPPSQLEMASYFISIVGAPSSGKSYFLASMSWSLRKNLPKRFHVNFMDADPLMNRRLQEYESLQFLNDDENAIVKLAKTEEQGDLYNTILVDGQRIMYPQPFIFALSPLDEHRNAEKSRDISLSLCLYDNAGESYQAKQDSDQVTLPVTRHLGKSHAIFFLFDPLQDNRFRALCRKVSSDPQLNDSADFRRSDTRQEVILAEMIKRTRSYRNIPMTEKYPNPVIVIVTKADAWRGLLPNADFHEPWAKVKETGMHFLLKNKISEMSGAVRSLLLKQTPEIVSMVEQFASEVIYFPVSATGTSPTLNAQTHENGFRTKDLRPMWTDIPVLYALSRSKRGIIPMLDR